MSQKQWQIDSNFLGSSHFLQAFPMQISNTGIDFDKWWYMVILVKSFTEYRLNYICDPCFTRLKVSFLFVAKGLYQKNVNFVPIIIQYFNFYTTTHANFPKILQLVWAKSPKTVIQSTCKGTWPLTLLLKTFHHIIIRIVISKG